MSTVADNLEAIREKMARAAERSGRALDDVTLLAVTKTLPVERVREAIAAGVTHLGENRVQEADSKYLSDGGLDTAEKIARRKITLHMIGALQRNKARRAVELFDWVQSVDRIELLMGLNKAASDSGIELLPVLIEVNTTGEPAKSGVMTAELPKLVDALGECKSLLGKGLMTVARMGADKTELRRTFSGMRTMLEGLKSSHADAGEWEHLSMGMSDDYELAIEEGSTMVRLGRAVFGSRV